MIDSTPIIRLTDISVTREGREILKNVNLQIMRGDFIAITGPNGGGKTTLLRVILRLLTPSTGRVEYLGDDGAMVGRLSIGYLPQKNMIDSRFPITVREMVSLGLPRDISLTAIEKRSRVDEMIELIGLSGHADASIGKLSGGQLQRALMGRAIISKPELLVLDEPLSYVDRQFEQRIYDIVASIAKHTTVILVSHDMSTIASMANRHLIVDHVVEACHSHNHFLHYDCCDNHSSLD